MKTIAITAAILFGTFQMFASDLIMTGTTPKPFNVTIQGITYYSHQGEILVRNLAPGNYRITIFSENKNSHHYNRCVYTTEYITIPVNATVYTNVFPNNNLITESIVYYRPQKVYAHSRPVNHNDYNRGNCKKQYNSDYSYQNYDNDDYYKNDDNYYHAPEYNHRNR